VFTTTFVATTVEVQVVASVGMLGVVPFPAAPDAWLKYKTNKLQEIQEIVKCTVDYSDFQNLMGFSSKNMSNDIFFNVREKVF
jgi:hypothetical protein